MLPDDECEPLAQDFHLTSPRGEAARQWEIELSEAEESPTHQQQHSVHSAGGEVTGNPSNRKVADIYRA
jgi:hypothetical protein